MIHHEASVEIAKPIDAVFAFVDDPAQTPRWVEQCIELRQTSPGPKKAGTRLHYVHAQGSRRDEMDGVVTEYDKNALLAMTYSDRAFDVGVEFKFTRTAGGTVVSHSCTIAPKTLIGKLMTPLIRIGNRKQVTNTVARLKQVLETNAAADAARPALR